MSYLTKTFTTIGQLTIALLLLLRTAAFIYRYFLQPSQLPKYLLRTPADKASWALVTGATDGIGLSTARELLARGFNVLLHGRNAAKLARVAKQLGDEHTARTVWTVVGDATQPWEAATVVREVVERIEREQKGVLKVLVNNVGGSMLHGRAYVRLAEMDAARVEQLVNVNAVFPTELTRQLLPTLQANEPSLIVNVGSVAGNFGMANITIYSACKAFNHIFSSALQTEMMAAGKKVEVLAVMVGDVVSAGNVLARESFLTMTSPVMARTLLERVGCGATAAVVGGWKQHLSLLVLGLLPPSLTSRLLRDQTQQRREAELKML